MSRARRNLLLAALLGVAAATAGCGTEGIQVAKDSPDYQGAEIFHQRCGGCHTLSVAGTQGSATNVSTREYKDGPSFDQRTEGKDDVLFAIENGGFSSGPMPQNIVLGADAEKVADFVAKYSGKKAERPPDPTGNQPAGGPTPAGAETPAETQ
jgi:mono/diheme cytochrome c family protein